MNIQQLYPASSSGYDIGFYWGALHYVPEGVAAHVIFSLCSQTPSIRSSLLLQSQCHQACQNDLAFAKCTHMIHAPISMNTYSIILEQKAYHSTHRGLALYGVQTFFTFFAASDFKQDLMHSHGFLLTQYNHNMLRMSRRQNLSSFNFFSTS